jgi:hypothetical protein
MSNINDGGYVHPTPMVVTPTGELMPITCYGDFGGMTLRDWFAGQALIALPHRGCGADLDYYDTAQAAYQIADAMIAAREVKP